MKTLILTFTMFSLIACNDRQGKTNNLSKTFSIDTVIKPDTIYIDQSKNPDWQKNFGLTHDPDKDSVWHKPVSYYLNDTKLSPLAFEFYYGYFKPSDNGATIELFKYVTTSNNKLRPFYRWCLNKTIQIADGALWTYVGEPARQYSEKYPQEFFDYMDSDTSGTKYKEWTRAIYLDRIEIITDRNSSKLKASSIGVMKNNCNNCDSKTLKRIEKFVVDCYE